MTVWPAPAAKYVILAVPPRERALDCAEISAGEPPTVRTSKLTWVLAAGWPSRSVSVAIRLTISPAATSEPAALRSKIRAASPATMKVWVAAAAPRLTRSV